MSAIQELSPILDQFTERVRQAKDDQHLTIDGIADDSGLSSSTVTKIISGTQGDPKLSSAAAICRVLGLSIDELCGLSAPVPPDEELSARVHDLELANAELRGVDKIRLENIAMQKSILISALACFALSIVTSLALLAYLIGDAMHENIGLIQYGELSKPAIAAIIVIAAALINAALLAYRIYKHGRTKNA